jgi:hypothetical protein
MIGAINKTHPEINSLFGHANRLKDLHFLGNTKIYRSRPVQVGLIGHVTHWKCVVGQ